ncbi:hypothetical protein GCM10017711_08940 [Paeniglutamicibacter sulfureus]
MVFVAPVNPLPPVENHGRAEGGIVVDGHVAPGVGPGLGNASAAPRNAPQGFDDHHDEPGRVRRFTASTCSPSSLGKASARLHWCPVPKEPGTGFAVASGHGGSLGFLGAAGSTQAELGRFTVRAFSRFSWSITIQEGPDFYPGDGTQDAPRSSGFART